jgi:hypothetical protein
MMPDEKPKHTPESVAAKVVKALLKAPSEQRKTTAKTIGKSNPKAEKDR